MPPSVYYMDWPPDFLQTLSSVSKRNHRINNSMINVTRISSTDFISEGFEVPDGKSDETGMENLWKKSSFVIVCLMPLILFFGVFGNLLTVVVYSTPKLRRISINLLIMSLAVLDSGLLLTGVAVFVPLGLYDYWAGNEWGMAYTAYATKWLYPISSVIQMASLYLLCLITVERFIAIRLPFQTRRFCTLRNTKIGLGIVLAFSFAFNVVRFWEYRIVVNENGLLHPEESLRLNKTYALVYTMWLYLLFMFSFPFILLVTLNAIIIQSLRCAVRERSLMVGQEKTTHVSTTVMIVLVIGIFLACNTLPFILSIAEHFVANSRFFYFLIDLGNFLVQISAATNPIIYYNYNKPYRKKVREMWFKRQKCCCCFYYLCCCCCCCLSESKSSGEDSTGGGNGLLRRGDGTRGHQRQHQKRHGHHHQDISSDNQASNFTVTTTATNSTSTTKTAAPTTATPSTNFLLVKLNNQGHSSSPSSASSTSLLHHHRQHPPPDHKKRLNAAV